ncbi:MAG: hypothetical protein K9W44_16815 [Candidatus Lokiarchaeota archaeon]|nr:hypothetical protein [Candidatus Harpocratesius repetitus]
MAKKPKKAILIYPKIHSTYNSDAIETALVNKAKELLELDEEEINFIFLSGNFFDARGWAYSAIRSWRGAIKPSSSKKRPILDATFACLSVYLSSLISFQADFAFAYDEIKEILNEKGRDDLWAIIEEKLPFVSLPPAEMFPPGLKSPIAPYYTLKQDEELFLGELYSTVFLSNYVKNMKSRYYVYFSYRGYSAFGYFSALPKTDNFGFDQPPRDFNMDPTEENFVNFIKSSTTLKDLMMALIEAHNNSLLEQFLVDDYETFLNQLLEIEEIDEGEG